MNRAQRIAVVVSATAVLLMLIFPPFHVKAGHATYNMGYAFIFDPPKLNDYITASVNVGMLLVQWTGTLILTGLAFFLLKSAGEPSKPKGYTAGTSEIVGNTVLAHVPVDQAKSLVRERHHPWRRFFARGVDDLTFVFPAFFVCMMVFSRSLGFLENVIASEILVSLTWLLVEAAFLSRFGATPGKWLFGVRVVHLNGELLSFSEALHRSFLVWFQGLGMRLPVVPLFTQAFAYWRLKRTGTTLWDTDVSAVVKHQKWGVLRALVCTFAVLCAGLFFGVVLNAFLFFKGLV